MASNDSFDISVRHSDPSESANSSEGSFLAEIQQGNVTSGILFGVSSSAGPNAQSHIRLLDSDDADDDGDDDDDDDLDENDGEDDAVTMELTGTVNMGAYRSEDEDNIANGVGEFGSNNQDIGASSHGNAATHDTSLLDNILSQYETTQPLHTLNNTAQSVADTDYTRVGIAMDVDDEMRDETMYASLPEQAAAEGFALFGQGSAPPFGDENMDDDDDDDEEEGADGYDDAVTMDLTGVIARPPQPPGHQMAASEPEGEGGAVFSNVLDPAVRPTQQNTPNLPRTGAIGADMLETLIASNPSVANNLSRIVAAASPATPERASALSLRSIATPTLPLFSVPHTPATPASSYAPQPVPHSSAAPQATPRQRSAPRASSSSSSKRLASAAPTPSRSSSRARRTSQILSGDLADVADSALPIEEQMPELQPEPEPTFQLDLLPAIPFTASPPQPMLLHSSPSLADHARAGLVFGLFDAYRQQELTPKPLTGYDLQATYAMRYEPLFRKAKLSARLDYCSSLASLFEVDRYVSQIASATPTDFAPTISYFEEQNGLLAQRKEELLLRISKSKQRLTVDAPNVETGGLAAEIRELKAKLGEAKRQRDAASSDAERLSSEIQVLQTTSTSFGRQVSERKSAQNILLAINGLQLADVADDRCDFVYDKFAKLHLDTAAEFTSLHPDIDWVAVVKDNSGRAATSMRQDAISAMKTNAVIKELLEDVKRVKRHTFVELSYNDGVQVRIQFFSKAHRRRFYLQIAIGALANYKQLHREARFDWATEVVYGEIDLSRFKKCLRACKIDMQAPLLSIYQHVDQSMDTY
ncbi:hypothetical protein GGI18_000612 [Coemansia linderi]|uniref:Uncharacterized protein n=1 Tax=Coemansia linderi TaxID=2663919 RepID=A0ACC1KMA3_9FUNG|nr:hypothetical protein GGI18_000612 [Coemansia linderi]